jgi:N-acetylglucosamine-1-phosphodiester alpha-N-acetylglucosaminidase
MTVQETGDAFATIQSARTAVGHDRLGRLVILSIDGKSYQRGVSLYEMAELLTKLGE